MPDFWLVMIGTAGIYLVGLMTGFFWGVGRRVGPMECPNCGRHFRTKTIRNHWKECTA